MYPNPIKILDNHTSHELENILQNCRERVCKTVWFAWVCELRTYSDPRRILDPH